MALFASVLKFAVNLTVSIVDFLIIFFSLRYWWYHNNTEGFIQVFFFYTVQTNICIFIYFVLNTLSCLSDKISKFFHSYGFQFVRYLIYFRSIITFLVFWLVLYPQSKNVCSSQISLDSIILSRLAKYMMRNTQSFVCIVISRSLFLFWSIICFILKFVLSFLLCSNSCSLIRFPISSSSSSSKSSFGPITGLPTSSWTSANMVGLLLFSSLPFWLFSRLFFSWCCCSKLLSTDMSLDIQVSRAKLIKCTDSLSFSNLLYFCIVAAL